MKYIIALAATFAASTAFADAPAGAAATACDVSAFVPVMSADGARVLYWNNATCAAPSGVTDGTVVLNVRS